MKPTQMVLLLVLLVVIVFAVTFASMYVSEAPAKNKPEEQPPGPGLQLTFFSTAVPEERNPSLIVATEFDKRGHHDFWFRNDNDQAVLLGLREKNCECSVVKVFIAPSDWHKPLAEAEARRKKLKDGGKLAGSLAGKLADDLGKAEVEHTRKQLLARADLRGLTILDSPSAEGIAVPPGAFGFVRLDWEWDKRKVKSGPQQRVGVDAKMWMQDAKTGPGARLFAAILYVDPVRLDKDDFALGVLNQNDVKTDVVYCWSPTRSDFRLEAKPVEPRLSRFIRCEVEKLNEQERGKLRQERGKLRETVGPIVAGYRVTLAVRERLDTRTRFDEGPFEYRVELLPFDGKEKLKSQYVTLRGVVRGDVLVEASESGIHLDPFPANRGTRHEVVLSTQQTDLDLQVDSHPPFMKVPPLTKEKTSSGLRWKLRLEIGPNQVAGKFPQAGNEAYKDTTIYLKIGGEGSRLLRIPVFGTAEQ